MANAQAMVSSHSERPRPAVFWALVEFHRLADGWLSARPARALNGCRDQILRALLRATTAVNRAAAGRHKDTQLQRARDAMLDCETAMVLLHGVLGDEVVALAMARIDQIMAGLDQLQPLDVAEWPAATLAPIALLVVPPKTALSLRLRRIATSVSEILQLHQAQAFSRGDPVSSMG